MAAYTSTQSGNWNSTATWGGSGYPSAAGDTFTIANGHTVTYNVDAITTGFGDACQVAQGGRLEFASGTRGIRVQGNFNVYGDLIMGAGHTIYHNNASYSSSNNKRVNIFGGSGANGNRIELKGSDPLPVTTLSANATAGSGKVTVTSSSGFGEGEWIAVFIRNMTNHTEDRVDEGFIIHEVSGNDLYLRQFVTPKGVITGVQSSNTKIRMSIDDAKMYRKDQDIIFGTGSNRNVKTISAINYKRGVITLTSAVSGSVVGETVYLTGPQKTHVTGNHVRKCATIITSEASSSATTITVRDATGFEVGDEIVLESLNQSDYSSDERPVKQTISSISGNNITVGTAFGYTGLVGAYVVKLTRDCRYVNETNGKGMIYFHENNDSTWNRYRIIKDFEIKNAYNSHSSYAYIYFRGRNRDDYDGDSYHPEGLSINLDTQNNYSELRVYRYNWRSTWRCCTFYNMDIGFYNQNGYDNDDMAVYNSWFGRMEAGGINYYYAENSKWEVAYNRFNGMDDYAIAVHYTRGAGLGIHHNSGKNMKRRAIDTGWTYAGTLIYQNEFIDNFEGLLTNHGGHAQHTYLYNKFTTPAPNDFYSIGVMGDSRYASFPTAIVHSIDDGFKKDNLVMYGSGYSMTWDEDERAYHIMFDNDHDYDYGPQSKVFVPAGGTLKVVASIKLVSGYSGNSPLIRCRDMYSIAAGSDSPWPSGAKERGTSAQTSYSNTDTGWQTNTTTLSAVDWDRMVLVSNSATNPNASEGWYLKKIKIYIDKLPPAHIGPEVNYLNWASVSYGDGTNKRIRLGAGGIV